MSRTPKTPKPSSPVTPQKIRVVLRKAGLYPSHWIPEYDDLDRVVYSWSRGYRVGKFSDSMIQIDFMPGHRKLDSSEVDYELARIASALATAGIASEISDGAVWVRVNQEQASKKGDTK